MTTQNSDSIASRCMLVSVSFSMPPQSKKDKTLTSEAAAAHKASEKSLAVTQFYWPEGTLDEVRSWEGHVRNNVLNHYGFPSQTAGTFIVPAAVMLDFMNDLNAALGKRTECIETAASKLDDFIAQSQVNRNGLFRREDYPADAEAFKAAFTATVNILPFPTKETFGLVKMADAAMAQVKALADQQCNAMEVKVHQELAARIKKPLVHLIKTLKADGNRWQSSTVENLREIAKLCKGLNIRQDATLDGFAAEIEALLAGVSMEALKENKTLREDTAKKADAIATRMAQYGF